MKIILTGKEKARVNKLLGVTEENIEGIKMTTEMDVTTDIKEYKDGSVEISIDDTLVCDLADAVADNAAMVINAIKALYTCFEAFFMNVNKVVQKRVQELSALKAEKKKAE